MRAAIVRWEPAVPVAAGCGLLLIRPYGPVPLLAALYAALGAMALAAPVQAPAPRLLHPLAGIAVGFAAVAIAPLVVGPAPAVRAAGAASIALYTGGAVAEEALFRRVMYARFERWGPLVAVGVPALAFAALHIPLYSASAFPVDLGAALLLGWQRWATGSWLVPAATHAFANLVMVLA